MPDDPTFAATGGQTGASLPPMLTTIDGRVIYYNAIRIEPSNQRFYLIATGEDLTRNLKQSDKRQFPGFDATLTNDLYYREAHPDAPEVGSTSTTANFFHQIFTDPLDAPAAAATSAIDTLKSAVTSPAGLIVGGIIVLGLLIYFLPRRVTA